MSAAASYAELGRKIGALVEEKQAAYGDSFGKSGEVMRILYPDGIGVDQYDDALTVVRILDKLFRIATDRDAMGESPYRDIAGYGMLGAQRVAMEKALRAAVAEVKSATNLRDLSGRELADVAGWEGDIDAPIPYSVTAPKDDERVVLTREHYEELDAKAKANVASAEDGAVELSMTAYTELLKSRECAARNAEREMAEVVRLTDRVRELTVANEALKEQVDPMSRLDIQHNRVRREEREFWADRIEMCFPWPLTVGSNVVNIYADAVIAALRTNNRRWPESKTP